jgi:phosphodiesterase/alkaline phosphatase D-like protein
MTQPPCSIDLSSHLLRCLVACVVLASFANFDEADAQTSGRDPISLTHGPMLGQPTATSMVVWGARPTPASRPAPRVAPPPVSPPPVSRPPVSRPVSLAIPGPNLREKAV